MVAHPVEPLIPFVSDLKRHLETVTGAYVQMSLLIEREHRAIREGVFSEAQTICEEKEVLTQTIESGVGEMTKAADEMRRLTARPITTLSEVVAALKEYLEGEGADGSLAPQVLKHLTLGVERAAAELEETARRVKPMIEANRDLVSHLMVSYGQSYRFWQEIQEQASSSYTHDGTQKVVGRLSGFRARA